MSDRLLQIELPTRYSACGDCAVAIALASKISTPTVREEAARNQMDPNSRLKVHCSDWVDSQTTVSDPKRQTVMQAQVEDSRSIVGLTEPEICECPGKGIKLPSQSHLLQNK